MRCPACPKLHPITPPNGPSPCPVMLIGERPGKQELYTKKPFVGDSGQELNQVYLPLAGLSRSKVYVTNAVKCYAEQNRTPNRAEIESCAGYWLPDELTEVQPEVVILLGSIPASLTNLDLKLQHGIPQWGQLYGYEGWLVAVNHPASGLHETRMMNTMLDDWAGLDRWLKTDEWTWPEPDTEPRRYTLARTKREVEDYFDEHIGWSVNLGLMGGDTESHGGQVFSAQVSLRPYTALMVLTEDTEAWHTLGDLVGFCSGGLMEVELVLHNAPADIDIFERMAGCGLTYRDTMQEAYHLGLPQGLKDLAYRVLGRTRQGWDEVVGEASQEALLHWLSEALVFAENELRVYEPRVSEKTGKALKPKLIKSPLESSFTRIMRYTLSNPEYDCWLRMAALGDEPGMAHVLGELGGWPIKGIRNCDIQSATEYACSDADDTLRLELELELLRKVTGKRIEPEPEDVDLCLNI